LEFEFAHISPHKGNELYVRLCSKREPYFIAFGTLGNGDASVIAP
jgi:hypothetical protein